MRSSGPLRLSGYCERWAYTGREYGPLDPLERSMQVADGNHSEFFA